MKYQAPEIELLRFAVEDIITSSIDDNDSNEIEPNQIETQTPEEVQSEPTPIDQQ